MLLLENHPRYYFGKHILPPDPNLMCRAPGHLIGSCVGMNQSESFPVFTLLRFQLSLFAIFKEQNVNVLSWLSHFYLCLETNESGFMKEEWGKCSERRRGKRGNFDSYWTLCFVFFRSLTIPLGYDYLRYFDILSISLPSS